MKRRFFIFLLLLALAIPSSFALAANRVTSIDINVLLEEDGSALITQVWRGRFSEGTECYIPLNDSGYLTVENLAVYSGTDETTTMFETLSGWDVDADFDEKAYRCGVNHTDNGYELCWGISEYGEQTYTVQYTLQNLVRAFDEADGFNFMFVNRNMNTTPTDVSVWIETANVALSADNSAVWAFGFDGEVQFEEGGIAAWTNEPISSNNFVILMLEMNHGILSPQIRENGSFEDLVKEPAMNGSDYSDDSDSAVALIAASISGIVLVVGGLIAWAVISEKKRKEKIAAILAHYPTLDALPTQGNLAASWKLGQLFGVIHSEGSIIGALILRLLRDGCLATESGETDEAAISRSPLLFCRRPDDPSSPEAWLFDCLLLAHDCSGLLTSKSAKRYFKEHDEDMRELLDRCNADGSRWLLEHGYFTSASPSGSFKHLSAEGEREIARLLLLKQWLTNENAEHQPISLSLEDCFAYALLFELESDAVQRIQRFYPDAARGSWHTLESYYWYAWYFCDYSYGEMQRAEQARSAGSGGSSSLSGGGGFSGGGSGGGTR